MLDFLDPNIMFNWSFSCNSMDQSGIVLSLEKSNISPHAVEVENVQVQHNLSTSASRYINIVMCFMMQIAIANVQ